MKSALLTALYLFCTALSLTAGEYHWPLAKEPAFTSSFCEFRSGWRFHAGIDLKTWGRTGYDVLAIADGYIWRVRVAPNGYGRAIYLKLADGRMAVYGHLESFNDAISALVRQEQEKNGSYRVNLYPGPDALPVTAGTVLGKSGRSGIRYPHLHFELRNAQQEPLNPQRYGFNVDDTTPPVPTAVSIRPFGCESTVDGGSTYRTIPLNVRADNGDYIVPAPVFVTGTVGLGIANFDRADAAAHNMNVYELRLYVDDLLQFVTRYDSISYAENHLVRLDREYLIKAHGDGLFQRLYRDTGNTLRLYRHAPGTDGRLRDADLAPGPHPVTVELLDYNGNTACVRMTVVTGSPPKITNASRTGKGVVTAAVAGGASPVTALSTAVSDDGGATWHNLSAVTSPAPGGTTAVSGVPAQGLLKLTAADIHGRTSYPYYLPLAPPADTTAGGIASDSLIYHRTFAEWHITLTTPPAALPAAYTGTGDGPGTLTVRPLSPAGYTVLLPLTGRPDGPCPLSFSFRLPGQKTRTLTRVITITRMACDSSGSAASADSTFTVSWSKDGLFYDSYLRMSIENCGSGIDDSLPALTPCHILHPQDQPFFKGVQISLALPNTVHDTAAVGLYARWGADSWGFISNALDRKTGRITARVKGFAAYALRADHVPPVITGIEPADGSTVTDNTPLISARITDRGSGFDDRQIECRIDGTDVIYEWDAPMQHFTYRPRTALATGSHTLLIAVTDNAGNRTERTGVFTVPE